MALMFKCLSFFFCMKKSFNQFYYAFFFESYLLKRFLREIFSCSYAPVHFVGEIFPVRDLIRLLFYFCKWIMNGMNRMVFFGWKEKKMYCVIW